MQILTYKAHPKIVVVKFSIPENYPVAWASDTDSGFPAVHFWGNWKLIRKELFIMSDNPPMKDNAEKIKDRDLHDGPWICDCCGNWARTLENASVPGGGMKRNYDCGCGGKFWPGK